MALVSCIVGMAVAGCADFGRPPSWLPFQQQPADEQAVPTPAERIERLGKLAQRAAWADPDQNQQISGELTQAIRTEEDPMIRAEIIRTLGAYRGTQADAVLRAALSDPDPDVRLAACEAWGKRADAQAAQVLAEALDSDLDADVRLAAARALGETKGPAAGAALGRALEDKDPAMQYRAVLSLRRITGADLGNDVNRWRQYVRGELPEPPPDVSLAERLRRVF